MIKEELTLTIQDVTDMEDGTTLLPSLSLTLFSSSSSILAAMMEGQYS